MSGKRLRYVKVETGKCVEARAALPTEWTVNVLNEHVIADVMALLRTMDADKVLAVQTFALCLKVGAVSPTFFTLMADALRVPGASE